VIIVTYPGAKKNADDDGNQVYRDQLPIVQEEEPAVSLVEDEEMEERLSSYREKRLVTYGKYAIAFTELNLQSITQTS
jgi:cytochrome c-type biogenesis protein CcmH/NrfG